jgi:cytoskeleton protein RodZ
MSPPDAEITELPSSPGARLKREREARGLTEQQAAEILTLDPSVVYALEANEFGILGAPVFVKGHLRRYATMLGLPDGEIVGAYERSKQHMAEPTLVPRSRLEMMPERGSPKGPWVLGGAIAFVVAALLAAYVSENGLPWVDGEQDSAAAKQLGAADRPDLAEIDAGGVPAASSPESPVATTTPDVVDSGTGATGGTGGSVPGAAVAPDAGAGTTRASSAGGTAGVTTPGTAVAVGPGQVQLQLRFKSDSWVEVFDGSGRAVLYDLGKAGTERTLTAVAPLSVTLGNAAAVTVAINGKPVAAPRQAGQVMARFSVAPDGALR